MMKKGLLLLTLLVGLFTLSACSLLQNIIEEPIYSLDLSANIQDAPLTFSPSTLERGTDVTVTASKVEGYEFVEWLDTSTNAVVSEEASFTFMILRNRAFKAIYEELADDDDDIDDDKETLVIETGFDQGLKSSYAAGVVEFGGLSYMLNEALIHNLVNDQKNGTHSVRMRENGYVATEYAVSEVKSFSFLVGNYLTDAPSFVDFEISINGTDWLLVEGMIEASTMSEYSIDFKDVYTELEINAQAPMMLRVKNAGNTRVNIDDFKIEYTGDLIHEGISQDTLTLTLLSNIDNAPLSHSPDFIKANETVTVTAGSVTNYNFLYWQLASSETIIHEDAEFTMTMNADMTLVAIYEEDQSSELFVYEIGFNENLKSSYAEEPVEFDGLTWVLSDALLGSLANDQKNGAYSVRLRDGFLLASFLVTDIKEVSFYIGNYLTDGASVVSFEVSEDNTSWHTVDNQIEADVWRVHTVNFESVYETLDINPSTGLFIRITSTGNNRVNIDDFKIVYSGIITDDYTPPADDEYYTVTLRSNVQNAVLTVNPGDSEVVEGTQMLVSAGTVSGYTFTHWEDVVSGDVLSTERQYSFALMGHVDLRAVYEADVSFPNDSTRLELTLENVDYYYSHGDEWTGATCTVLDLVTDETVPCLRQGEVDTSALGTYSIVYYAEDADGKFVSEVVTKIVFRDASLLEYDYSYNEYYSGLEGLYGENLVLALRSIIEALNYRSYGEARYDLAVIDEDPSVAGNVLLVYNRASVDGTWDAGVTWNREHVWPNSRLGVSRVGNNDRNIASDLHNLRAANPSVNSSRGNKLFDFTVTTDTYYPGEDRGDVARIYFYMATLYSYLVLGDELPGEEHTTYAIEGAMHGYLSSLISFHYDDPVDAFEHQRNDAIYSYQNNRNPFIDYPHLVELIWYDHPNIPLP